MNTRIYTFSWLILLGCAGPDSSMLPGKYCFNGNTFGDIIFVNADHTYTRKFVTETSDTLQCKGEWLYHDNYSEIQFKDYILFYDTGPSGFPPGDWLSAVKIVDGEVQLIYSSDDNSYYSKCE